MVETLETIQAAFEIGLAAVLGAVLASFLCVVAERVPAGEGLGGRSHCVCGRQLEASENVPVLGWLAVRGRARCCGAKIPVRYVAAEAGLAAWCALCVAVLGTWVALAACVLGGAVCCASVWAVARRSS